MVDSDENRFIIFKNTKTPEDMVWKLLENMRNPLQNPLLKGYHTDVEIVTDFPIEKRIKSAKNHSYFCRLPPLKCF